VTFCLSKGLCAPVGSVLVGSKDFIAQARRARKMLGGTHAVLSVVVVMATTISKFPNLFVAGGMRQAGVLAAAGLISLNKMAKR
jgi:threonine aldolase